MTRKLLKSYIIFFLKQFAKIWCNIDMQLFGLVFHNNKISKIKVFLVFRFKKKSESLLAKKFYFAFKRFV